MVLIRLEWWDEELHSGVPQSSPLAMREVWEAWLGRQMRS